MMVLLFCGSNLFRLYMHAYGGQNARRQAFIMILSGYETTATALTFAIHLLCTNPAKRDKLLAEVDAFGRNRAPTLRDLDQCAPLLQQHR